jgi:metallo-beta-lactamase family protein
MKIHFYGAARTVTGSQHLIEVNGKRLLRTRHLSSKRNFTAAIPILLLIPRGGCGHPFARTIDHSGNLPNLVKQGYRNPIYARRPPLIYPHAARFRAYL